MGVVYKGIPPLAIKIQKLMLLDTFVETGTFKGDPVAAMAPVFSKIFTIEQSPHFAALARQRFASNEAITVCQGDSRRFLPEILNQTDNLLLWLDAHWSQKVEGQATAGAEDQCPLLEELQLVSAYTSSKNIAILIDDARLFMAPPPASFDLGHWPTIDQVISALPQDYACFIYDDVIFLYRQVPAHNSGSSSNKR